MFSYGWNQLIDEGEAHFVHLRSIYNITNLLKQLKKGKCLQNRWLKFYIEEHQTASSCSSPAKEAFLRHQLRWARLPILKWVRFIATWNSSHVCRVSQSILPCFDQLRFRSTYLGFRSIRLKPRRTLSSQLQGGNGHINRSRSDTINVRALIGSKDVRLRRTLALVAPIKILTF